MLILSARIRKNIGKKVKILRKENVLPGVLYGPEIKSQPLEVDLKEFEKIYEKAGESSLISLEFEGPRGTPSASTGAGKKLLVLIHEITRDPLTGKPLHVDFYQPKLKEEIVARVPIVIEGISPVVKDLGGTLVRYISELEVKALPQKLPKEITVNVGDLKTFEDHILIKNLRIPEGVKILKDSEEIIVSVLPPEKIEEELEKPAEEKIEEIEQVKEPEKQKEEEKIEEEK